MSESLVTTPESATQQVVEGTEPPRVRDGRSRPRGPRGPYKRRDPKASDPTTDGSILTTVATPVAPDASGAENKIEPGKVGRDQDAKGEPTRHDPRSGRLWNFVRW